LRLLRGPSFLGEYVPAPTLNPPAGTQTATCSIQVLPVPTLMPMRAYNIPRTVTLWPGRVLSKSDTGQINEVLCKVLCHSICVVIQSIHELGIEPIFCTDPA